jgi:hypothetical protein
MRGFFFAPVVETGESGQVMIVASVENAHGVPAKRQHPEEFARR